MLMDPEGNIKNLKEMLQICKGGDQEILILGLKSLVAVFKDIIPGYMIKFCFAKDVFIPFHASICLILFCHFSGKQQPY